MKHLTKLTLVAATAALFGTAAAMADDSQASNQRDLRQAQMQKENRPTTVAFYGKRGVGNARTVGRAEVRLERRDDARGTHFVYLPLTR